MESFHHKVLSIVIVCILAASAIWVAFAYAQETKEYKPPEIQATVCSYDSFENAVLDISSSTYLGLGYSKGDYVDITTKKGTVEGFTTENFQGLFTFEIFININDDGTLSLGCCCAKLPIRIGDSITINYNGPSDRKVLMPHYFESKWVAREGISDETQVNYRSVSYGDIAEGRLYRSSNAQPRYTDEFPGIMNEIIKRHDADYLVNMNADRSTVDEYRAAGLLDEDNAEWYIDSESLFAEKMSAYMLQDKNYAHIFQYIADNDGSYLIFCHYGKDRTGFTLIVLEALMGATVDEIIEDYSYSYACLYGTSMDSIEYQMYRYLVIPQLVGIHDPGLMNELGRVDFYSYDVYGFDLRQDAENYLVDFLGLTHEDVDKIRQHLSTPIE